MKSKLSVSGTIVWPGICLEGYLVAPLGCHSNHPPDCFNKPKELFLLLLKLLISFETLQGYLMLEVNSFQPSFLAFLMAFLYSLLKVM